MGRADYFLEGAWNFRCSICEQTKPVSEFVRRNDCVRGCTYACKVCRRGQANEWSEKNRELRRQYARDFRRRNLAKERERVKQYRIANRAYMSFRQQYRDAMKKLAIPKWNERFVMEEAYRLAALRTRTTGLAWHVDHVVPIQSPLVCGLHVHSNLRVIPAAENHAKGNRYWPEMPNG